MTVIMSLPLLPRSFSLALTFACFALIPSTLLAQNPIQLPHPDYYAACDVLRDGRTVDANAAFRTLLRPLNVDPETRSLDAIPLLTMLGESYYQMGELESALEHLDGALTVSLRANTWYRHLSTPLANPDKNQPSFKGVGWWTSNRKSQLQPMARQWPVSVGEKSIIIRMPNGQAMASGTAVTLDAIEILRCQAWAIRRRTLILQDFLPFTPLSQQLPQALPEVIGQIDPQLLQGHQLLTTLATWKTAGPQATLDKLAAITTLPNGMESCLTPLILLVQADCLLARGDSELASQYCLEAAYLAAAYGQTEVMAEAVHLMTPWLSSHESKSLHTTLQDLLTWSRARSKWLTAAVSLALAEAAANKNDWNQAALHGNEIQAAIVAPRNVKLPLLESNAHRLSAWQATLQGNLPLAVEERNRALEIRRDDPETGPTSLPAFRCQLANKMLQSERWTGLDAWRTFAASIENPTTYDWALDPIGCVSFIQSDRSTPCLTWMQEALKAGDGEQLLHAIDAWQRQQFYQLEGEGGRLTSLRRLFAPQLQLNARWRAESDDWKARFPDSAAIFKEIAAVQAKLDNYSRQWDTREWNDSQRNLWTEYANAIEKLDRLTLAASLARQRVHIQFPLPAAQIHALGQLPPPGWSDDTCLLGFFTFQDSYHGILLAGTEVIEWRVGLIPEINGRLSQWLESFGYLQNSPPLDQQHSWAQVAESAQGLSQLLLSEKASKLMANCRRCYIVPSGALWNAPLEALPVGERLRPLLETHQLAWFPTLGQAMQAAVESESAAARPPITNTLGVVQSEYLDPDASTSKELAASWSSAIPQTTLRTFSKNQATRWQASRWARSQSQRIWIAGMIPYQDASESSLFGFDAVSEEGVLRSWLRPPLATPRQLILPGTVLPVGRGNLSDGRELFELACILQASGNESTLLGRWPTTGSFIHPLLQRYLESLLEEQPASAWQRAVLAYWEEPTPLPRKGSDGVGNTTFRSWPWLWSGFMQIGD